MNNFAVEEETDDSKYITTPHCGTKEEYQMHQESLENTTTTTISSTTTHTNVPPRSIPFNFFHGNHPNTLSSRHGSTVQPLKKVARTNPSGNDEDDIFSKETDYNSSNEN